MAKRKPKPVPLLLPDDPPTDPPTGPVGFPWASSAPIPPVKRKRGRPQLPDIEAIFVCEHGLKAVVVRNSISLLTDDYTAQIMEPESAKRIKARQRARKRLRPAQRAKAR
jgi:hypothetical protein